MIQSISSRLIAVLTLCAAAIIGGGMLVDYRLSRTEILNRLEAESQDTIGGVITDMENWLDGVEGATLFLARILEQREYSLPGLEQMLKDIVENNEDIFGATIALNPELVDEPLGFAPYYFHREGILTYANLALARDNYQQQTWFLDTVNAGTPIWVEPYYDRGGGEILMTTFAVPVFRLHEDGSRFLYAVVTADVSLQELHSYLQRLRIGASGFAILLSREGIILSGRNPDNIMLHYSEVPNRLLDIDAWREIFQAALHGQTSTRQLECPEVPGRCMIRLGALQSTGWPVGIVYSQSEVLQPLRDFQIKTSLIGTATLLLMGVAVYWVTRRLTRPLSTLAMASDNIARGQLDSKLPTARGKDEIARLIRSFTGMQRDLTRYIEDLEQVTASRSRLQGELAAATDIQMSMLPGGGEALEHGTGYQLWCKVRPAKSVGGDLYTYYHTDGQLFLAVGDVSDKGVPAALFMAKAISLIQQLAGTDTAPDSAMAQINNALEQGNDNCMFVTLFLGVLDLQTLQLRFASAGHSAPGLLRNGEPLEVPQQSGPALGLATDLEFSCNTVQLQAGDRLAVYTDGIDEAFNAQGQMFGVDGFYRQLQALNGMPLAKAGPAVFAAVDGFAGGIAQSDDITLLLLDIAADQRSTAHLQCGRQLVSSAQQWLERELAGLAPAESLAMELALVMEEVVTNIDKYAGLAEDGTIAVTLHQAGDRLELEVRDAGKPFDPLTQAHRAELGVETETAEIGGLGVHLITQLTDQQHYRRDGDYNVLRLVKHLPEES